LEREKGLVTSLAAAEGRVMRACFIPGFVGLVVLGAAVVGAASLLDTTERPPAFEPQGHPVTEMSVPGRDAPVTLHLWHPTGSDAATVLVGQNGLFYGEPVRPDMTRVAALGFSLGGSTALGLGGVRVTPSSRIVPHGRTRRIVPGWSRRGWISPPSMRRAMTRITVTLG
jgi:hypothetical protein